MQGELFYFLTNLISYLISLILKKTVSSLVC